MEPATALWNASAVVRTHAVDEYGHMDGRGACFHKRGGARRADDDCYIHLNLEAAQHWSGVAQATAI